MKAMVWTKYGSPDGLQLQELAKPAPQDNEVLIRVYATTVTAGDCELRSLSLPLLFRLPIRIYMGIRKPKNKILGQELAGEVEAVGNEVTEFKKGDQVFAATLMHFGAYAEYVCLPETYPIAKIPSGMTFEEAATIPTGGMNALHFLRKGNVQSGERVLINGAGGSIGTYAVQIAKSFGAIVTAVDSTKKLDMLRSIGADHVIDYTQEDFTARVNHTSADSSDLRSDETYDVIIDVVGKSSFSRTVKSLRQNGRYILGNPSILGMIRGLWTSMTSSKKVLFELADYKTEDINYLKKQIEAGQIKSVIDRRYTLEQIPDAHRYVEKGDKTGNVVISVSETP